MKRPSFDKSIIHTAVLIFGLLAFRSSLADQYVIPSGSMEPTIQIGDHVLVDKRAYDLRIPFTEISLARTGEPIRGDVVVFKDPRDPSICLIKRLIGLPGDRVMVRGEWVTVPPEQYYFLGDNRGNSADSRVWGFARRQALLGKAKVVLYSLKWDSGLPALNAGRSGTPL
jgi:signal peptidase I